eukprot:scaffold237_cov421-Prasinococcus_capsulatus_cf.AAC.21
MCGLPLATLPESDTKRRSREWQEITYVQAGSTSNPHVWAACLLIPKVARWAPSQVLPCFSTRSPST